MTRLLVLACALTSLACTHRASSRTYTAGDTMVPTLAVGTRVAVSRLAGVPARGVAVVFRAPERPDREYVKRIVGLPGDTISTRGDEILVNGAAIPRCQVGPFRAVDADGASRDGAIWLEALDGSSWLVFHSTPKQNVPSGPWTVAPGEVFVLGDSRENSHDSRFWYGGKGGGLPLRFLVGTVSGFEAPVLPQGAEALEPALATCKTALGR